MAQARAPVTVNTQQITPMVKPQLSLPHKSFPPRNERWIFFFPLLKKIDFQNKHFSIYKQALPPEPHILISLLLSIFF